MPSRKHVVITGTGRAGTTFLVSLLTELGLDTGFRREDIHSATKRVGRAGLEFDIRQPDCPYVVKNPRFCEYAREIISRPDISIEHVLIPVRDLNAAAESRRHVQSAAVKSMPWHRRLRNVIRPIRVAGGLWRVSMLTDSQETELLKVVYALVLTLSDTAVPVTLLRYPRIVNDSHYLYAKLEPILNGVDFAAFNEAFNKTVRPNLVHHFNEEDR